MAASDHLNDYIKMYHIAWDDTPPHELRPYEELHAYREGRNIHPDVLHMGNKDAALQIWRTHLHEYEVDPSVIDPITYGDEEFVMQKSDNPAYATHKKMKETMRGVQPTLWESIPGDPREAVKTGNVISYRNHGEDAGSISFMVPKSAIASGKVRYVGFTDASAERQKREAEKNGR